MTMPGSVIGQDAVFEIDDKEHDHRASEQQALNQHRRIEEKERTQKHRARDELDDRVFD